MSECSANDSMGLTVESPKKLSVIVQPKNDHTRVCSLKLFSYKFIFNLYFFSTVENAFTCKYLTSDSSEFSINLWKNSKKIQNKFSPHKYHIFLQNKKISSTMKKYYFIVIQ